MTAGAYIYIPGFQMNVECLKGVAIFSNNSVKHGCVLVCIEQSK